MYRISTFVLPLIITTIFCVGIASAAPDQYMGDNAIYGGTSTSRRPNVLFLIDNSKASLNLANTAGKYDETKDYPDHGYKRNAIYEANNQGNWTQVVSDIGVLQCSSTIVKESLLQYGNYAGDGSAARPIISNQNNCVTAQKSKNYALGNYLNYINEPSPDGSLLTAQQIIYNAIETVVGGKRHAVNFGAMVYSKANKGGTIIKEISDLSNDTDFDSFRAALPQKAADVLSSETLRPQAEALFDAGRYFEGKKPAFSPDPALPSPIKYWCDTNYIIDITIGLPFGETVTELSRLVGDFDKDGQEAKDETHYLDDVAKMLYEADHSATLSGFQRIVTNTILAFVNEAPYQINGDTAAGLIERTANASHGRGKYFNSYDAQKLIDNLEAMLSTIVLDADTSFVAPVVPVSPENRTYSGSRVYMGFFKPISQTYWRGNLKKYGIDSNNNITDKNSEIANYVDLNEDGKDDNSGLALPVGAVNGTFKSSATSFWSSSIEEGGDVEKGGAGSVLLARDFSTNPRKIFTYTGTNTSLTHASNAFSKVNSAVTATILDVADSTAKDKLVDFIYGIDTYDDNGNGNSTEKRAWILGDILHSKPLIVNYASYEFSGDNEGDPSKNKSMIFVGANDGMLHAFNDYDGSEAWAFIPPDILGNLKYIHEQKHTYFADSSPNVYIYDANNDGNIDTNLGDRVILVVGQRRGGGTAASPTKGSYYALDVSNPAAPVFLWSIDSAAKIKGTTVTATTDYSELAETWSEPKLVKMKIGGSDKIIAFVGAGYDNAYEDSRYGATQTFSGTGTVDTANLGAGFVTSSGEITSSNKGKGVYAIEIADLNSGAPVFNQSGDMIKSFTPVDYGAMKFSFPGEITALDMDNNGYVDRLYAGDVGGNIWRFDVGDTTVSKWTATRIFSANPGYGDASDTGRKIFYKPSAVVEPGNLAILYFGTGDREHPLNRDVIDRLYALKDKGQSATMTESNLVDVTLDLLQTTTDTSGANSIANLLAQLNAAESYGWYIKLDQNSGEKVLASPTVFNKVAYFTTYAPKTTTDPDPCQTSNLGTARLYAVDYLTGEAVLNYDRLNDTAVIDNKRAKSVPGQVLVRSDRSVTLGSGIPSGIVLIINPNGGLKALIGVGGVIPGQNPKKGGSIIPLYWRQK